MRHQKLIIPALLALIIITSTVAFTYRDLVTNKIKTFVDSASSCTVWSDSSGNSQVYVADTQKWNEFINEISICEEGKLLIYPTQIEPDTTSQYVKNIEIKFEPHPLERFTTYQDGRNLHGSYSQINQDGQTATLYLDITTNIIGDVTFQKWVAAVIKFELATHLYGGRDVLASTNAEITEKLDNSYMTAESMGVAIR